MESMAQFFDAWSESDAEKRQSHISQALSDDCIYSDPRSQGRLQGVEAISTYVGMFSASAPGWSARVKQSEECNGFLRALVVFSGPGPDGSNAEQHGTYFAQTEESGKLVLLVGFVER